MSLWTKIFGEPDDWRYVGKVNSPYFYKSTGDKYVLTYYLYENQDGKRKFDVIDSNEDRGDINVNSLDKKDWVFRTKDYRHVVHPWLNGFRNPDFPTYKTAPNHDFKRLLEGGSK
jgi:hypothetical protein